MTEEEDKITSIRVKRSTVEKLEPYKKTYGSFERGILELIKYFEGL